MKFRNVFSYHVVRSRSVFLVCVCFVFHDGCRAVAVLKMLLTVVTEAKEIVERRQQNVD